MPNKLVREAVKRLLERRSLPQSQVLKQAMPQEDLQKSSAKVKSTSPEQLEPAQASMPSGMQPSK
jgi:hypothetical protein